MIYVAVRRGSKGALIVFKNIGALIVFKNKKELRHYINESLNDYSIPKNSTIDELLAAGDDNLILGAHLQRITAAEATDLLMGGL